MSLQSPRFNCSKKLLLAATGGTLRQGACGRHIHLVQMALIDLGYAMPRSTGNVNYSPDGVFGNEMKATLIAFQKANPPLAQTGEIDRATMLALDSKLRGHKHRVRLHFRSISLTNFAFDRALSDAEVIFGQYGIRFEFASGMSLGLTAVEETKFAVIDAACNWVITDGEINELQGLGTPAPPNDVLVYYVKEFKKPGAKPTDPGLLGCGGHAPNRPACAVAATASRWDTAHEVCHVLLTSIFPQVHINDVRNLMHPTASTYATTPVLTDRQVAKIRSSPCCIAM